MFGLHVLRRYSRVDTLRLPSWRGYCPMRLGIFLLALISRVPRSTPFLGWDKAHSQWPWETPKVP